jgi:hypothetical protein
MTRKQARPRARGTDLAGTGAVPTRVGRLGDIGEHWPTLAVCSIGSESESLNRRFPHAGACCGTGSLMPWTRPPECVRVCLPSTLLRCLGVQTAGLT